MKKFLLAAVLGLGVITVAKAAYISGDYPVCISEDALDRLHIAASHDDKEAVATLMQTECLFLKEGFPIEKVVSQGWTTGVAHIKVYIKGSGSVIDVWTNKENLKAGKKE
ncbi:hypothetical protein [Providencia sp. 2024EL-00606]|uniref:hypothetical protein n=1 Tax=Providencia sp. 2024EL-00606 TaxID=3350765 RepID=UPI0024AB1D24|nr:hypothetical protein [Providencia rettgeri]MDX4118447.1 hypothetical protein [Providencia rettgeri]